MTLTKQQLADQLLAFLNQRLDAQQLATWAEEAMLRAEYPEKDFDTVADLLAKLGLVNVKGFEQAREFYLQALESLGFGLEYSLRN